MLLQNQYYQYRSNSTQHHRSQAIACITQVMWTQQYFDCKAWMMQMTTLSTIKCDEGIHLCA